MGLQESLLKLPDTKTIRFSWFWQKKIRFVIVVIQFIQKCASFDWSKEGKNLLDCDKHLTVKHFVEKNKRRDLSFEVNSKND
jgi:hypothetical protein